MAIPLRSLLSAPVWRMIAVIALSNLFVLILAGISLKSSHDLYQERAAVSVRNTSLLVAQGVAAEMDRIDLGLKAVVDEYARQRAGRRVDRSSMDGFLARLRERLPMVDGIRIADAAGDIVSADEPIPARIWIGDRDHFQALRDEPKLDLVIAKPVQSRVNGRWVLSLARRLNGPQGEFEGVVVAPVAIDWIVQKFRQVDVGENGAVVMRGDASRDFDLLARFPDAGFVGQTTVSAQFRAMIERYPSGGSFEAHAAADHIHRTFSYARVGHYPLVVLVGLGTDDILAEWRRGAEKMAALVVAFLIMTVVGGVAVGRAWRSRLEAQQKIQFLAYHDVLTGLPNRLLFQDRFDQARARADRDGVQVALFFLDLDQFKTINDSLGHQIGDQLLVEVASRLRECLRESDTVSRQGGDEFLLLLTDLSGAEATAAPLLAVMNRLAEPFRVDGQELTTSASVGVSLYPQDGSDFETLAKKADMAMYRAKEAGRNTYRFFDEQMNVEAVEHLTIRNGLRRALERGEFVLHYQPQIELGTGHVIGVEALIRWQHPELGLVPPGRFIGVAEESRLIVPMGEWVLGEACRQAATWRAKGLPPLMMAVNLSAVQFKRGDVQQTVAAALESSGHDPAWLELEFTESTLIQNADGVLATVQQLKRLGVRLSIDDFGTGYSSFSYLKRFHIDKLKIDQSFVRDLTTDPNDAAIVRAIIQMGRSLNLKVIAEGVENGETMQCLRGLQCDEAQGYFFARPMPAVELEKFLGQRIRAA